MAQLTDTDNKAKKGQARDEWVKYMMGKLKLKNVDMPRFVCHYFINLRRLAASERSGLAEPT